MLRIDRFDPMLSSESCDQSDHLEPVHLEPVLRAISTTIS